MSGPLARRLRAQDSAPPARPLSISGSRREPESTQVPDSADSGSGFSPRHRTPPLNRRRPRRAPQPSDGRCCNILGADWFHLQPLVLGGQIYHTNPVPVCQTVENTVEWLNATTFAPLLRATSAGGPGHVGSLGWLQWLCTQGLPSHRAPAKFPSEHEYLW